ncbi:MAG: hypothetical protein ACO20H_06830 [Bacteriovoracaceae bacterium]
MGLLPIERIVLEELQRGKKTKEQITESTGLSINALTNILRSFFSIGIISIENGLIQLNKSSLNEHLVDFNSTENKKAEVCEIASSLLKHYFDGKKEVKLSFLKVSLDEFEKEALDYHLRQIKEFLNKIKNRKNNDQTKLKEQTLFLCSYGPYEFGLDI